MILIISRTIVDVIKTSFGVIGGPFRVKIDVFCESRKSRRTIFQFFANYEKSKGFRAQGCYKCQYKLAYCGHFEPKNKSLRPSEAEIAIACNRDYARKKGVAPHGGLQREKLSDLMILVLNCINLKCNTSKVFPIEINAQPLSATRVLSSCRICILTGY